MAEPCSRLCIKNIPAYVDEEQLRKHFGEKGEVTDARVIRAGDGHSRQFAFVGFKTTEVAQLALNYFNRSYLDSSRMAIEFAVPHGTEAATRAWSKYTTGTTANARLQAKLQPATKGGSAIVAARPEKKAKKRKNADAGDGEDPKLREFLEAMQPRRKAAIWSNDAGAGAPPAKGQSGRDSAPGTGKKGRAAARAAAAAEGDSSDDEYTDLPAARSVPSGAEPSGASESGDDSSGGGARDPAVTNAGVSDLDYLRSRVRAGAAAGDDAGEDPGVDSSSDEEPAVKAGLTTLGKPAAEAADGSGGGGDDRELWAHEVGNDADAVRRRSGAAAGPVPPQVVHASESAAQIAETGRLFLRNLSYAATEGDLTALLEKHGELKEVHLCVDRETGKSKGIALVQFVNADEAVAAHAAEDAKPFQGRLLHILPGHRPPSSRVAAEAEAAAAGFSSFKEQREAQRKAAAAQGDAPERAAWNSLYMSPDTVAEAVAARLGVAKAAVLDPTQGSVAAQYAKAELEVLHATKSALGAAGVAVDQLEAAAAAAGKPKDGEGPPRNVARSSTTLLAKNLSWTVTEEELQDMFSRSGEVLRLVLPPTHVLALVEFQEASAARAAFASLAYRRLRGWPMYLEWAPASIWGGPLKGGTQQAGGQAAAAQERAADLAADEAEVAEPHTLFVKNLAFKTRDPELKRHFGKAAAAAGGALRSAKVSLRTDKKGEGGAALSHGFGFVECSSEAVARAVLDALQGSNLDGHKLQIFLSQLKRKEDGGKGGKGKGKAAATKLMVRNVAFEATRKDIRDVFQLFGLVKSVRLPSKFDKTHRGFAFVEFGSKQEATAALEATAGIHLYGRRLVVEWAKADDGLDEVRAKTAAKYHDDKAEDAAAAKQSRLRLQGYQALAAAEDDGEAPRAGSENPKKKKKKKKKRTDAAAAEELAQVEQPVKKRKTKNMTAEAMEVALPVKKRKKKVPAA